MKIYKTKWYPASINSPTMPGGDMVIKLAVGAQSTKQDAIQILWDEELSRRNGFSAWSGKEILGMIAQYKNSKCVVSMM